MKTYTVGECQCRLWHGLIPAVPVPLTRRGELDAEAQKRYVAFMAEQPVAAVAVWAHTGRGLLLSREQRLAVLRSWSEGVGAGKLVVAGVGGSREAAAEFDEYIASALDMAREARENGAHAFLVYPPRIFHHAGDSEETILEYHRQLAALGTPLVLFYLYEAAGGVAYSPALLRRLLALPEVVGIKLATLDSVMAFQDLATLVSGEFPQKLLISGEDRFLGYSLMCGAQAALIGMGAACTALQHNLLKAYYEGRALDFLRFSWAVDRLSQVLFVQPMEGYIRRMLWALVHSGVIARESAHDPWGPEVAESQFDELGKRLRELGELSTAQGEKS